MFNNLSKVQIGTVITFLFVPILSSLISTIHIVDFFKIGNFIWMSYVLAVAFEIGSIASAIALTVLDKISKIAVWSIFIILVMFQLLGNVFFSFEYITKMQIENPEYLNIVSDFLNYFYVFENPRDFKVILSILIGMPIPLISLAFLKSVIDYISNIMKDQNNNETLNTKNVEEIKETEDVEETKETENFEETKDVEETENIEETEDDEKKKLMNNKYDENEIKELIEKKEKIEKEYDNMVKMKKQLEDFYPQIYGKKYNK